jgi:hypothetical protein
VKRLTADWSYDVVSIAFPGPVLRNRPVAEPRNLGEGWVGFNFRSAFGCRVKLVNEPAMQGLGSYKRGKMLFLGLAPGSDLLSSWTVLWSRWNSDTSRSRRELTKAMWAGRC